MDYTQLKDNKKAPTPVKERELVLVCVASYPVGGHSLALTIDYLVLAESATTESVAGTVSTVMLA